MGSKPVPAYLVEGYPQSLVMLRVRNEPDKVRDELLEVLTRADEAASVAWEKGGMNAARTAWRSESGPVARALLEEYFPGQYEAWEVDADKSASA